MHQAMVILTLASSSLDNLSAIPVWQHRFHLQGEAGISLMKCLEDLESGKTRRLSLMLSTVTPFITGAAKHTRLLTAGSFSLPNSGLSDHALLSVSGLMRPMPLQEEAYRRVEEILGGLDVQEVIKGLLSTLLITQPTTFDSEIR